MEHRRPVHVDLHAVLEQSTPLVLGRDAHDLRVDVAARHEDADAHAASPCADQLANHQPIGDEVSGFHVDPPLGGGDRGQVHEPHAVAAALRRADEHLHVLIAARLDVRKIVIAVQDVAGGLDPVVEKRRLHLRGDGTGDLEVHVAPVLGILGVARPLIRDPDAAGEAQRSIDDQDLAMRAVIQSAERVPAHAVIALDLDPAALHAGEQPG